MRAPAAASDPRVTCTERQASLASRGRVQASGWDDGFDGASQAWASTLASKPRLLLTSTHVNQQRLPHPSTLSLPTSPLSPSHPDANSADQQRRFRHRALLNLSCCDAPAPAICSFSTSLRPTTSQAASRTVSIARPRLTIDDRQPTQLTYR